MLPQDDAKAAEGSGKAASVAIPPRPVLFGAAVLYLALFLELQRRLAVSFTLFGSK